MLACLGNRDHWTDADVVAGALADAGLTVLRNAAREVADNLWVAAVDDVWERYADLEKTLRGVPSGATVVLLAHEPDYVGEVAASGRVSLQLSGHSHGGQVRLPFIGAPFLPYLGRKYPAGLYRVGGMWLYVNRGVGLISPAVRFNCRPEVTLLRLRRPGRERRAEDAVREKPKGEVRGWHRRAEQIFYCSCSMYTYRCHSPYLLIWTVS